MRALADASGNEIIFAGKIRVEKGSFTPKDETEPESTYEHYYKDSTGEHLGGKDTFDFVLRPRFGERTGKLVHGKQM